MIKNKIRNFWKDLGKLNKGNWRAIYKEFFTVTVESIALLGIIQYIGWTGILIDIVVTFIVILRYNLIEIQLRNKKQRLFFAFIVSTIIFFLSPTGLNTLI